MNEQRESKPDETTKASTEYSNPLSGAVNVRFLERVIKTTNELKKMFQGSKFEIISIDMSSSEKYFQVLIWNDPADL